MSDIFLYEMAKIITFYFAVKGICPFVAKYYLINLFEIKFLNTFLKKIYFNNFLYKSEA